RRASILLYLVLHCLPYLSSLLFFFNDPAPTEIYTLSLHDALPISTGRRCSWEGWERLPNPRRARCGRPCATTTPASAWRRRMRRSGEHTSELQSLTHLVCRLLLEKKKKKSNMLQSSSDDAAESVAL